MGNVGLDDELELSWTLQNARAPLIIWPWVESRAAAEQ